MAITKNRILLWITGALLLTCTSFAVYIWVALSWSYSQGERAGYVQKFSKKGWVCKTWEGELSMVQMAGAIPEKFFFTVRDEAIAQQINKSMGKRVNISYEQHMGLPTTCFGETQYFATNIKVIE